MILKKLSDNSQPQSFANRLRRKRFERFLQLVNACPRPLNILDIGGTQKFWECMNFLPGEGVQITLLNKKRPAVSLEGFKSVRGDARDLSYYEDNSFDLVISNSVIEHVGSFEDQRQMAKEIMRVGRFYFVQTPNYYFILEPHFPIPGFQFIPRSAQIRLMTRFSLGWVKRSATSEEADEILKNFRLLRLSEIKRLFPRGIILRESLMGLTKSFMVTNFAPEDSTGK